jgi:hypothetical protein
MRKHTFAVQSPGIKSAVFQRNQNEKSGDLSNVNRFSHLKDIRSCCQITAKQQLLTAKKEIRKKCYIIKIWNGLMPTWNSNRLSRNVMKHFGKNTGKLHSYMHTHIHSDKHTTSYTHTHIHACICSIGTDRYIDTSINKQIWMELIRSLSLAHRRK